MTRPTRQRVRPSPTTLVGLLALLAALLVLPLALAPRAEAFVYWTDVVTGEVGRANLDGSDVDTDFAPQADSALSVAVGDANLYWTSPSIGAIGRVNLDGSGVEQGFIVGTPARPEWLAVNAGHVYWTNGGNGHTIGRANLDGTGVRPNFLNAIYPYGLAIDAAHLYWYSAGQHAIQRANLDASGDFVPGSYEPSFISGLPSVEGLAVDAAHIYWTNRNTGTIGRANLDGSGVEPSFISGASTGVGAVAVDAAHVYWANGDTIGRASLDGSDADPSFITGVGFPAGIAVNFSLGKPKKDKKRGTAKLTVEVPAPGSVALSQNNKLKAAEVHAEAAGEVQLTIKPRGRAKKKLAEKGKVKVKAEVTYTPDGGEPETQLATLGLKR